MYNTTKAARLGLLLILIFLAVCAFGQTPIYTGGGKVPVHLIRVEDSCYVGQMMAIMPVSDADTMMQFVPVYYLGDGDLLVDGDTVLTSGNFSEGDGSVTNEGSLTVGAGSGSTSVINSNTSGSTPITVTAGTGLSTAEAGNTITLTNTAPDQTVAITGAGINAVTGTYPSFTVTGTEVDGSTTNELLEFTASSSAPGSPKQGDLWHDSDGDSVFVRDGGAWVFMAIRAGGGSATSVEREMGADTIVPIPTAFDYDIPFDILRNGSTYQINPEFSLRDHANISVSKTYYVDYATGSDSDNGLTYANAFKSISVAAAKTDVDRIVISKGTYPYINSLRNTVPTRSIEWIGDLTTGTGDSVWITQSIAEKFGSWTNTSNYYSATYTISNQDTIARIYDNKAANRDQFGDANDLTLVANVAAVDATPGSWYVSGTTVYIRTIDSRAPDADIELVAKNGSISNLNGRLTNGTHYFKDINFRHTGLSCIVADSTGGLKVYIDGARIMGGTSVFDGTDEVILFNVIAGKTAGDIMNYDPDKGINPNAVEYNCWLRNTAESGSGTNLQASTVHNGCKIVRINGEYEYTQGQNIADVNDSQTLMYGVTMRDAIPATSAGFYASGNGVTAWLERCTFDQNSGVYDIQNTGDTIYHRYSTFSQTNNVFALLTYVPNETFGNNVSEMMETAVLGDNDYLYLAKQGDGELLPVKLKGNKVAGAIGALTQPGMVEGAREQAQKFRKGVHINGANGAALSTKALTATTPALRYYATTGQTGNVIEGYNASGTLIMRQLADGSFYAGDASIGSDNFSFLSNSGNPVINIGGKTAGQQCQWKFWSGTTHWNIGYQGNDGEGAIHFRYNNSSGGRMFRFTNTGRMAISSDSPTAKLHISANGGTAGYAPIKFATSGASLISSPEVGAIEVASDKIYYTIPTGTSRKEMTLNDAALTSGEIPVATTNGRLTNSGLTVAGIAKADSITALRTDINNLQTLSGRPDGSTHLGTFTGATISDNVTIKAALQSLETKAETDAIAIDSATWQTFDIILATRTTAVTATESEAFFSVPDTWDNYEVKSVTFHTFSDVSVDDLDVDLVRYTATGLSSPVSSGTISTGTSYVTVNTQSSIEPGYKYTLNISSLGTSVATGLTATVVVGRQ